MDVIELARVASRMRAAQIKRDDNRNSRIVREAAGYEAELDRLLEVMAQSDPIVRATLGRPLASAQLSLLDE